MIHDRTTLAITMGTVGGYMAGNFTPSPSSVVGFLAAGFAGAVAIWITPDAEEIALQWRAHQRIEEEREGSA